MEWPKYNPGVDTTIITVQAWRTPRAGCDPSLMRECTGCRTALAPGPAPPQGDARQRPGSARPGRRGDGAGRQGRRWCRSPPPRTPPQQRGTPGSCCRGAPARKRTVRTRARGSTAAAACSEGPPCTLRTRLASPTPRHQPCLAARCTVAPAPRAPARIAKLQNCTSVPTQQGIKTRASSAHLGKRWAAASGKVHAPSSKHSQTPRRSAPPQQSSPPSSTVCHRLRLIWQASAHAQDEVGGPLRRVDGWCSWSAWRSKRGQAGIGKQLCSLVARQ
jgi:hypothetical protein